MTTLPLPMIPSYSPLIPVIVTPLPKTTIGSTYTYIQSHLYLKPQLVQHTPIFSCKLSPTYDVHL